MIIRRSVARDQLHLFGLAGVAVAYPVYNFLLTNPAYLVANRVTSGHLYITIGLLSFALPGILIVIGTILSLLQNRLYRYFHLLSVWGFLTLAILPLLSRIEFLSVWLVFCLSAGLSLLVTREYQANMFTYTGLLILAPVALGLPVNFVLDRNISQLLNPGDSDTFKWDAGERAGLPPIIMIVYDELPLVHLLDAQGNIDPIRFPNFARLGRESTWYTNASAVHDHTISAVPAILTGQYPKVGRLLPIPENYPQSLFAILRAQYEIHANESLTALSGTGENHFQLDPIDMKTVAADMVIFYMRSMLPLEKADAWLPLQNGMWGGFLSQAKLREWLDNNASWRTGDNALNKRVEMSQNYVRAIQSYPPNSFHYFHIALPHRPFGFLPSGRQYEYLYRRDRFVDTLGMTQGEIDQGRAAHILQVGLADRIMGMFQDKLVELGYWDDALVIVVADHGMDFRAGKDSRILTLENFGNVAFVPLFIKYPYQEAGAVDDTNVQTIDIAPTVFDLLDIRNAPQTDGRSLLDKSAAVPSAKRVLSTSGKHFEVSMKAYERARTEALREATDFFTPYDSRSALFNYGPGIGYVGKKLDELDRYRVRAEGMIDNMEKFQTVDPGSDFLPVFVQGKVVGHPGMDLKNLVVAIAVNNVVRGVTKPYVLSAGELVFDKILPEDALGETNNVEAALLVADTTHVGTE